MSRYRATLHVVVINAVQTDTIKSVETAVAMCGGYRRRIERLNVGCVHGQASRIDDDDDADVSMRHKSSEDATATVPTHDTAPTARAIRRSRLAGARPTSPKRAPGPHGPAARCPAVPVGPPALRLAALSKARQRLTHDRYDG